MKIRAIVWNSYVPVLTEAAKKMASLDIKIFSSRSLKRDPDKGEEVLRELAKGDLIFLYRTSESFWEELAPKIEKIGGKKPLVCLGYDPSYWMLSNVAPEFLETAYKYIVYGGKNNFANLLAFLANKLGKEDIVYDPPERLPFEGIYHPEAPTHFDSVEKYLDWYRPSPEQPVVGLLISRHAWVNGHLEVENRLVKELEGQGLSVIPVFSYSLKDEGLGARGSAAAIRDFFLDRDGKSRIDALVKMIFFFVGSTREKDLSDTSLATSGVELLKKLSVPVFQPVTSYYRTVTEWEEDSQGLSNEIGWSVAMPEFEGVIEPIIVGVVDRDENEDSSTLVERKVPIVERCARLAERVKAWTKLKEKPPSERRVAFVLHNNPCASVEATVGTGAHLDTLESVARIMKAMKEAGYQVETPPETGKALIDIIMERKAVSEFRWTTVEEIVKKGGALDLVPLRQYLDWWKDFPGKVRKRIAEAWGDPPGKAVDGVPAAMVYEDKIVVTGLEYGNAVVCVQPKRGCAGPRCDGRVCKILHDPDIPPPHQYLATYRWLESVFKADVVIHVGTHGNLEFLPGKGVGLSEACLPDLSIHKLPHLYIYNADNPPEGTIAKRRSYAVLVDHMQTVLSQSGLYDELEELDRCLADYDQAKGVSPARAHGLRHRIMDLIEKTGLDKEMEPASELEFTEVLRRTHEILSRIRTTQIQDGMHVFGELPRGERRADFIRAILRYDIGDSNSVRKLIAKVLGYELKELLDAQVMGGKVLEKIDELSKAFIAEVMASGENNAEKILERVTGENITEKVDREALEKARQRILDLDERINASNEIGALLNGMSGEYLPSGPSGLITRGRDDVLPTGRNFYSLDPERVPTKAAYDVGKKLAQALIHKQLEKEGKFPENIAIYWMCTDIMWSDGEGMGQILNLLGVKPVWLPNGRVKGFEIIPISELGRPRIDVTVRVSGITRDNFPNCIELVDEAVQAVAALDEPPEMNFVRKHTLDRLAALDGKDEKAFRRATFRIFASKPGTYQPGVNLAVYASAWKTERDLADIFLYWNGYAYGKGTFGQDSHEDLAASLSTVDMTFNKVVTDEYDLFGCCCHFGTHGGLTVAARELSGKHVQAYFGDTREPEAVEVRTLADEIRRVARTKLLHPRWIEGMKRHGYKGAGDISKRVGRIFGWQAATGDVDGWIFDEIAKTFVLDQETRRFFKEHNPYALEEIGRRLLEANERGLWEPDPEVLEGLKDAYLELEGLIEGAMGDTSGGFQGGAVDILSADEVSDWTEQIQEIRQRLSRS